jgi:hypothetical protein
MTRRDELVHGPNAPRALLYLSETVGYNLGEQRDDAGSM